MNSKKWLAVATNSNVGDIIPVAHALIVEQFLKMLKGCVLSLSVVASHLSMFTNRNRL